MSNVISLAKAKPSDSEEVTVEFATRIKDMADNGEIKAFCAVIELKNGTFHALQTRDESPHKTGGILLEMAIRRVIGEIVR